MTYDVLIIGSGAGGGPVAWTLARAGLSCLVLEKGPRHGRADFIHDEIAVCRRDFFADALAADPHTLAGDAPDAPGAATALGWIARCVGGGTVHMAGYVYRLHPEDFRMASLHGPGGGLELADWPFDYAALEPWYAHVEQVVGISGAAGENPFDPPRSTPYPLPPLAAHPFAAVLDRAAARLGRHPFSCPRAILSLPYGGRSACVYCDFCGSYGCEVGAKSSALEALLPAAEATGKCTIRPGAMVREITVGEDGRATGCIWLDAENREHRERAARVVVAASAVESARLLLLSRSARFPHGLANGNGRVGRHLHFSVNSTGHAVYRYDSGRVPEAVLNAPNPFLQRSLQDFYLLPPGAADLPKGGTIRFGLPHPNPIFTALKLAHEGSGLDWGVLLMQKLKRYYHEERRVEFECFADHLPNPGTFVDLDPQVKDRWGLPAARIHLADVPHHAQAGAYLQARGLELLAACGADRVVPGVVGEITGHLVHGTCRMGTDPATSVLDADGRAHECPNLYVTDGAALPHAGGVTSTLTIMANSFRIARGMLRAR